MAPSLNGPWVRQNLSGFAFPEWPWRDVNLGLESHAPILLANGSVLTFTRSAYAPHPDPPCAIFTVASDGEGKQRMTRARPMFLPLQHPHLSACSSICNSGWRNVRSQPACPD